jgi:tRNA(Ile)-lysidine synthase
LSRSKRNTPARRKTSSKRRRPHTSKPARAEAAQAQTLPSRVFSVLDALIGDGAPWPAAVGVSGGGDSLALLHLLRDWTRARRLAPPVALIVDHGLRKTSATEAIRAAARARKLGLKAHILTSRSPAPDSDIEAAAREARYGLMGRWLAAKKLAGLYVAHTRDDQAETFLLRLGRGSGLDGLSAMRPVSRFPVAAFGHLMLVRPLLAFGRREMRAHLEQAGLDWFDDPMNSDPRFGRAKIRQAWEVLEAIGLSRERLADAATHLARAREALDVATSAVIARCCRVEGASVYVDRTALSEAPRELALRALAGLLMAVSGEAYRPRFQSLERLLDWFAAPEGGGRTLHGCRIGPAPKRHAVFGAQTVVIAPESQRKA